MSMELLNQLSGVVQTRRVNYLLDTLKSYYRRLVMLAEHLSRGNKSAICLATFVDPTKLARWPVRTALAIRHLPASHTSHEFVRLSTSKRLAERKYVHIFSLDIRSDGEPRKGMDAR